MSTTDYIKAAEQTPPIRRRDSTATRAAILQAARSAFATKGYNASGLREIAGDAGVNSALVKRYFGSKEQLFEAALEASMSMSQIMAGGRENFGKYVVYYFTEAPGERFNSLPMMIYAAADPVARQITIEALHRRIIAPLGEWLGPPNGKERAARILMIFSGFFTYAKVLPLPNFENPLDPATRRWLEQTLQAIVDEHE